MCFLLFSFLTQKITLVLSELSRRDYSFLCMHFVSHAFYYIKGLVCAWKQGLSAKVFVMTKTKSENGWKNMKDACVWLILQVCWLAWVYDSRKCWQLKSWNWVLDVPSAAHCANCLLRYLLWNRWWIVTKHNYRHRYLILFRWMRVRGTWGSLGIFERFLHWLFISPSVGPEYS